MGTSANGPLGKLRAQTHRAFDPLWRKGGMTRDEAYQHLAQVLNLPLEQVHIACFDPDDCQRAIAAAHQLRQSICCVRKR